MIQLNSVSKQYGSRILYRDGSFQINRGEKIGLVGSNGSGKTTILRMIAGEETPDAGSLVVPDKVVVGYFSQNLEDMSGRQLLKRSRLLTLVLKLSKKS